ncbi:non-ribosomal peptide synthetase [Paenibacillus ihumii]|uniref:non-ribosomal peptide synthetase n=1 Tax=Paenibacillus ihumii TaxID=687436 RepID=UPI0009401F00|nr:non-ribosomal peptide synthetase [Paenibacillus ihumii]
MIQPLSPMQKGMLFHHRLEPASQQYFEQMVLTAEGSFDIAAFETSFNQLIERHDILRTVFLYEEMDTPLQVVLVERKATVYYEDISAMKEQEQEACLEQFTYQDRKTGFNLQSDLLIRAAVFKISESRHKIVLSNHHILMDGWCLGIIMEDLLKLYKQSSTKQRVQLDPVPSNRGYLEWLEKQDEEEALMYWQRNLSGYAERVSIPRSHFRSDSKEDYDRQQSLVTLGAGLTAELSQIAIRNQVTLNHVFLAMWGILLQQYSLTQDVVIGTVISGRPPEVEGIEGMVGLFINTIPLRITSRQGQRFPELLAQVQQTLLRGEKYGYASLADIQANSEMKQGLFDHIVSFQNFSNRLEAEEPADRDSRELRFTKAEVFEQTNYPLTVMVQPGEQFIVQISYDGRIFERDTIERVGSHFIHLANTLANDPNILVHDIDIVTPREQEQLLYEFNATEAAYPQEKRIEELFAEQAQVRPEQTAVVAGEQSWTYGELNARANSLARELRERGVGPEQIVGILARPSLEMIAGILGILKAGGAYLPIDPQYPGERIRYMLEDSGARLLLASSAAGEPEGPTSAPLGKPQGQASASTGERPGLASASLGEQLGLSSFTGDILDLEEEGLYQGDGSELALEDMNAGQLAYVIYTSGSTGQPKGVLVEHRSLVNLSVWHQQKFAVRESDRSTKLAGFGFDASVWEIFPYLISGAALHMIDEATRTDIHALNAYYEREGITISFLPTPLCEQFMQLDNRSLRVLLTGGDKLNRFQKQRYLLVNNYGPTENTVVTTSQDVTALSANIAIGRPIANHSVYILGSDNRLLPIGVPGELCISGAGLARGYLNREELTREKFVESPFRPGERMYRTGDLARWTAEGTIEYLGRLDEQVKIRGHRIEPGEIAQAMLAQEEIKEAYVLVHHMQPSPTTQGAEDGAAEHAAGGEACLCGYYTASSPISAAELTQRLGDVLPSYMVPSFFIQLEELPLNANGKVDRRSLPQPDWTRAVTSVYAAPESELETTLVELWQEVLGVQRLGIDDDFFERGGHSLKVTMLAARIQTELGRELPLRDLFRYPTVRQLAAHLAGAEQAVYEAIAPVEHREYYPASSAQKRLYAISQLEGAELSYNIPQALEIAGSLDAGRLERALIELIRRHESLRTTFELIEGELVQRVQTYEQIQRLAGFGLKQAVVSEQEAAARAAAFIQPFKLSEAPLVRAELLKLGEERHLLLLDMHHIIADAVSMNVLLSEWMSLYEGESLPELAIQYKDYAVWQQEQRSEAWYAKQEAYWLQELSGELPVLELASDKPRAAVQQFEGERLTFEIEGELTQKLRELSRRQGTTLYMTMLAAYNVLLHKYTGQEDLITGTPIAGRTRPETERVIGMFVNTLALRSYPQGSKTFKGFLEEVKQTVLGAQEHQNYSFEELVDKLALRRDPSRNPLFDTMFAYQHPNRAGESASDLSITVRPLEYKVAKVDLTLQVFELEHSLSFDLEYSKNLYMPATMLRMMEHFKNILSQIADDCEILLSDIDMMTAEEKELLQRFSMTDTAYPRERTISQLFEEQVAIRGGDIAVSDGEREWTYAELNLRANRIARQLKAQGVGPEQVVGIMAERSLEMAAGILGILKAGGAYLPIDPQYPLERISYMLEDSGSNWLLSASGWPEGLGFAGQRIPLDASLLEQGEGENLPAAHRPEQLAYIIYTSGSTGQPKGVMIEQRSVVRLVKATNYVTFEPEDRLLQTGSLAFDASTFELWGALLNGLQLHLAPQETLLSPGELKRVIRERGITLLWLTSSLFNQLSQADVELFRGVRQLIVGGEALSPAHIEAVRQAHPGLKLVNGYGPTENTTFSTYYVIDKKHRESIPIGQPISNTTVYIVDGYQRLQPIGVPGELCGGGEGLARGYLNREELTKEKFVESPFRPGERMYRTGDLARWTAEGTIEYLGRIDEQVKIRGHRIEPGEITQAMLAQEEIKEAYVLVHHMQPSLASQGAEGGSAAHAASGEACLCGYYTAASPISAAELTQRLGDMLPSYMVPSFFIQLDELPLNANGKVDRRSLPQPDWARAVTSVYAAPESELETALVELWQEVLGVQRLGIDDDFFERGGHSLKATMLISRIGRKLGREVTIRDIFRHPTVRQLACYLAGAEQFVYERIPSIQEREYYPASSAQKRLYAISQLEGAELSYNIPQMLEITGQLDSSRLEQALHQLIRRHDSLRTSFELIENELVQQVQAYEQLPGLSLQPETVSEQEAAERAKSFIRPFKLNEAPLLRVQLLKLHPERHLLLLDMHHIISDAVSVNVLLEEWMSLYDGASLPEQAIQYKDYAVWQQEQRQQERYAKQEAYWLQELAGELPVLALATDKPRPPVQQFEGDRLTFEIGWELTQQLREWSAEQGTTLYMTLLAAYYVLLHKYTGQEDLIVGTPIAGRTRPELERTIGMFVNTLALRSCPQGGKAFADFLQEVKQTVLGAQEHQEYPFEEVVEKLALRRDRSRNPLFDVMFSVQNGERSASPAGGLSVRPYEYDFPFSKFDLTLDTVETENILRFEWEFRTDLFERHTIQRMAHHFTTVLNTVMKSSSILISDIELLTPEEKDQLLYTFNDTSAYYPKEKLIHQLFEERVKERPEQIAVVAGERSWTYRELNEHANNLAVKLRALGAGPDRVIGLMAERSFAMAAGILGILKSGSAYLPIDPQYPQARKAYMLEDSGAFVLLAPSRLVDFPYTGRLVDLEAEDVYQGDGSNLSVEQSSKQLACIIYTSGSTGTPKGVQIEHHSIVNLSTWFHSAYNLTENYNVLQMTNFSFDVVIEEILGSLLNGATVHLPDTFTILQPMELVHYIRTHHIHVAQFVPATLRELLLPAERIPSLQVVICGGEKLEQTLAARIIEKGYRLFNHYGPTETTVDALRYPCSKEDSQMYLGRPIANVQVYITNKAGQLQPIGVPGELCISGAGLARGYLNREELTKEKFVANPFRPGERMYRTGDLARWTPEGTVEYLGRIDEQVKIRGHRIELGEITHQLLQLDQVRDAAVLTRQDPAGESILCAYLLTDSEADLSQWRRQLAQKLPGYMIPHHFVRLEQFPLTPNGKIDYKALPEPELHPADMEGKPPGNEMEALLVQVWKEVLGLAAVGVDDNFFERGGDSIKAVQIAARLHQQRLKLEVKHLFQYPTIEELSGYVKPLTAAASQEAVEGDVRFTPIQAWFMGQDFAEKQHWNQAFMLYREAGFEVKLVEASFRAILTHHDALRMVYLEEAGGIRQYNRGPDAEAVELTVQEWTGEAGAGLAAEVNRLQQELKLQTGPLVQLGLFHLPEGDHLLIVAHQLVIDGISWRILLEDFETGYRQASEGRDIRLPEKSHSFQAWAEELERYANSKALLREKAYWSRTALETVPVLPQDGQAAVRRWGNAETVSAELDEQQTKQLLQEVHTAFKTEMNDVLLAALSLAIGEWSGHGRVPVQLEGHGREEILEGINISRTIGWFTTEYPVVLEVEQQQGLSYHLKQTKETLRRVPSKGIGYGVLKYMTSAEHKEDLQFGAEPAISFNYLGQFDTSGSDGAGALFELSPLPTGQSISPSAPRSQALDITGAVTGGRLRIDLTYDREEYERQTMEQLAARYKEALLELIAHCLSRESTDVTPSDLGDQEMTMEELEDITALLESLK